MFVLWILASVVYRGFAESAVAADPIPNLLSKKLNESLVEEYARQNVTLDDVDENVVMIGAQKVAGNWTWLDETPFDYELWAPGEPNNWQYPGNEDEALVRHEDCVTIYFSREFGSGSVERVGKWNDNVCNEPSLVSICKKPAER
ncbi:unnamed protein product, partial [Mesorhabditis spiculigera]